jgi:2-polyprenyl-6-methoxyphenol hydroxylase-like FAD-dependent oxidoreductase
MRNRNVLISGAGPAGMTLAYWLRRHGFSPTVAERASAPRGGSADHPHPQARDEAIDPH